MKKTTRRIIGILIFVAIVISAFIAESRYLPPIAIKQLAELTNTSVKADSIEFRLNGSILISGLQIRPKEKLSYDNSILKAEKVYVRFGLGSLILLRPKLKKISVCTYFLFIRIK